MNYVVIFSTKIIGPLDQDLIISQYCKEKKFNVLKEYNIERFTHETFKKGGFHSEINKLNMTLTSLGIDNVNLIMHSNLFCNEYCGALFKHLSSLVLQTSIYYNQSTSKFNSYTIHFYNQFLNEFIILNDKEKIDQMSATIYKNYKMRSEEQNRLNDFQAELNCFLVESLHFLKLSDKYHCESDYASFQALFFQSLQCYLLYYELIEDSQSNKRSYWYEKKDVSELKIKMNNLSKFLTLEEVIIHNKLTSNDKKYKENIIQQLVKSESKDSKVAMKALFDIKYKKSVRNNRAHLADKADEIHPRNHYYDCNIKENRHSRDFKKDNYFYLQELELRDVNKKIQIRRISNYQYKSALTISEFYSFFSIIEKTICYLNDIDV